jgi:alginate O-acetyltransferase complex protein AlgI
MNFISLQFPIFLAVVMTFYLLFKNMTARKWILLVSSCVFYAWWDWRFLLLLAWIAVADYNLSLALTRTEAPRRRKIWLALSLASNLSILGFFKYFNFFIDSLNLALGRAGLHLPELAILLPIGISFYIFETLSYIIDVYEGRLQPARSLLDYAVFLTFFPSLLSGPIVRASGFLPQLDRGTEVKREHVVTALRLFGQGLVKKLVIADTVGLLVGPVFNYPSLFHSSTIWLGVLAFPIQIYFDFSGYSDMAIGVARLFGFELPANFNLPYTAHNVAEFWRRWHISLSSWFRDYLFYPLRRWFLRHNRRAPDWFNQFMPVLITMLLSGLWHGAGWTFIFWGGLQGVALGALQTFGSDHAHPVWKPWRDMRGAVLVYLWGAFSFLFFRASSMDQAFEILGKMAWRDPAGIHWFFLPAFLFIVLTLAGGFLMRARNIHLDAIDSTKPYALPYIVFLYLVALLFAANVSSPFIYFQF